jgi:hypothetical protein
MSYVRPAFSWVLSLVLGGLACTTPEPAGDPIRISSILTSAEIRADSAGAQLLAEIDTLDGVIDSLASISGCPPDVPLVLLVEGTQIGTHARGTLSTLPVETLPDSGELCMGEGRVRVLPEDHTMDASVLDAGVVAIEDGGASSAIRILPRVRGPVVVQGTSYAARIDLAETFGDLPYPFDDWTEVSGTLFNASLGSGEIVGIWSARNLHTTPLSRGARRRERTDPPLRFSLLATFTGQRVGPDVDTDGDGLEQFIDEFPSGNIDACIDGSRSGSVRVDDPDCPFDPRFVDAFSLRVDFRTQAVELVE